MPAAPPTYRQFVIDVSMTIVSAIVAIEKKMQRPMVTEPFNNYVQMLFFVQALLVVLAVAISRYIQNSWIGRGLQALKDDELAAECTGVPTLSACKPRPIHEF